MRRIWVGLVAIALLATLLGGCGGRDASGSKQAAATVRPTAVGQAAQEQATAVPADVEPSATFVAAAPSATAASAPEPLQLTATAIVAPQDSGPSAATPEELLALLGPHWQLAASGDTNHDGALDIIAYVPSTITPPEGLVTSDPEYSLPVEEAVIVQLGQDGALEQLISVNSQEIRRADAILVPYSTYGSTPASFMLRVDTQGDTPIAVIGLTQAGEFFGQGVGVYWDAEQGRYGLVGGGGRRAEPFPSPTGASR